MKLGIVLSTCCALAVAASSASAANGIPSSSRLAAMGLSGAKIVSDPDAMSVRGMGYTPSSAKASRGSFALVGDIGKDGLAAAGTLNVYKAEGGHYASGQHFSEAGKTVKHGKIVIIGGKKFGEIKVHSVHVFAGGSASSK